MSATMKKGVEAVTSRGGDRGFTLIEVMISMFFMLFIIESVLMTNLYAQRSAMYARRLTSANLIAEQHLEKSRNTDYDNLPALYHLKTFCYDANMSVVACAASRAVFTNATTAEANVPEANITRVKATVTWPDSDNMGGNALGDKWPYQVEVTSYITRY